jgi:N-acetyl-gamma-glutamyl-phosphate reductase
MGHRITIFGASGYAGGELVRLVDAHPDLDLGYLGAHSAAGEPLGSMHPHLRGGDRVLQPMDPDLAADCDLAFLALPHGASAEPALAFVRRGVKVVDLGSDYRLDSPARYEAAYGSAHPHPEELGEWVYGLPELFGERIRSATKVAAPGCYPTSAVLALAPLLRDGLLDPSALTVNSVSGVSGAGRAAKPNLTFGAVDEGVVAYGVLTHRHRPEIEQALGAVSGTEPLVIFTPHLVPMQRGILSTCYARVAPGTSAADLIASLSAAYAAAPFVDVIDSPPQTRWVVGSNRCLVAAFLDERSRTAIVMAAEDNLLKGAAGQAVQCANLMLGLPEETGLPFDGWMP